jgi:hypothetical protein
VDVVVEEVAEAAEEVLIVEDVVVLTETEGN